MLMGCHVFTCVTYYAHSGEEEMTAGGDRRPSLQTCVPFSSDFFSSHLHQRKANLSNSRITRTSVYVCMYVCVCMCMCVSNQLVIFFLLFRRPETPPRSFGTNYSHFSSNLTFCFVFTSPLRFGFVPFFLFVYLRSLSFPNYPRTTQVTVDIL